MSNFRVVVDDLTGPEIASLLQEHLDSVQQYSPPESIHALDLSRLRVPEITFWCAWDGASLAGCGALKEIDSVVGEIKSMRTSRDYLRRRVGSSILKVIIDEARRRQYQALHLETGAHEAFEPARRLYRKAGFVISEPFAEYTEDRHSVFMRLDLTP